MGLSVATSIVIPTLFPFLVLGTFLSKSGLAAVIGARLEKVVRRLFGLPGCCAAALLVGFLGGYPAGGAVIGDLVRSGQLNPREGERALRFCVCGGPGFIINTVGVGLMGSSAFGILLYSAQVLAALFIGLCSRRKTSDVPLPPPRRVSGISALVDAVTLSCQSALSMCGFLVLFSALLSIFDTLPLARNDTLTLLLSCLCEVACGCVNAAKAGGFAPLLLSFAMGFGGLSVHCQLSAVLRKTGVLNTRFFVFRFLHGALAALLTSILLRLFPVTLPVFSDAPSVVPFSGGVGVSVCLLMTCGIWLLYVDKKRPVHYNE